MPFCNYCNNYFFDINSYYNMELIYFKIIHNNTIFKYQPIYNNKYTLPKNIMCCKKCKKNRKFKYYPVPTICYVCLKTFPSKSKYCHHKCCF